MDEITQQTEDAIAQLTRYSGRVANKDLADALSALACLNDDVWHDRHPDLIETTANIVRMHLNRVVRGARK